MVSKRSRVAFQEYALHLIWWYKFEMDFLVVSKQYRAASFLSDRRRGGGLAVDRSVARSMLARLISESPPIGCLSRELVMDDERSTRSYLGYVMCGHSDGVKVAYGRLHNAFADIPFHIRLMRCHPPEG
ncbi:hypothetical protein F2Q70_00029934 [Brassica cretica]|uniref:Uncharacterized protein n=1 Tax=Brassica cretica TaxID=69181 RepID=A0A8S9FKS9_BRACR|nr:hypothetical protein F2Q70_00029934 [Brassica cretica]